MGSGRSRIEDEFEPLAGGIVDAADAVDRAGLDLGRGHQRQELVLLLCAHQREGACRVVEQVLSRPADIRELRLGTEKKDEARLRYGAAASVVPAQGRARATASAIRGLIQIVCRRGSW